jgi:hypothetical protein
MIFSNTSSLKCPRGFANKGDKEGGSKRHVFEEKHPLFYELFSALQG